MSAVGELTRAGLVDALAQPFRTRVIIMAVTRSPYGEEVGRDRHPKREYEGLLGEAEGRGWRVSRGKGYFKCYCPCADKHHVRVALTPSGSRTLMNTRKSFERATCWERGTQ